MNRLWRAAQIQDDPTIIAMCRELNREDPGPRPVPDTHMISTLRNLRDNPVRGCAVVLALDAKVQGYALLISFWSNELGGEVCYIDELFVAAPHRSRGHATALIQELVSARCQLWPRKPVVIELEVTPNNTRARAMYSRLGFEPTRNAHMRARITN